MINWDAVANGLLLALALFTVFGGAVAFIVWRHVRSKQRRK